MRENLTMIFLFKDKGEWKMLDQMQGVVVETLVTVILALITLVATYATYYIKKAAEKLKIELKSMEDEKQKVLLDRALDRLEVVASKTVNKIEQVTAKKIRKAIEDGKADRKELEALAYEAYGEIINTLEPEYIGVIENSLGDARTYILNTVEEKVKEVKTNG